MSATHICRGAKHERLACFLANGRGLGYLLESGTISAKSLQPYLSAINAVHNDFEYPSPACGHLVKLARKGFAELQGSSMLHNRSKSRRFRRSTCSPLSCTVFD
jgi:hypothetical protein